MELREFFASVGGDYDKVLQRLASRQLILRFVRKFAQDPSYTELKEALEKEDFATAFRAVHTLKGTAANLGLDVLAEAASELTEQLRAASVLPQESYVEAVDKMYRLTIEKIGQIEESERI